MELFLHNCCIPIQVLYEGVRNRDSLCSSSKHRPDSELPGQEGKDSCKEAFPLALLLSYHMPVPMSVLGVQKDGHLLGTKVKHFSPCKYDLRKPFPRMSQIGKILLPSVR